MIHTIRTCTLSYTVYPVAHLVGIHARLDEALYTAPEIIVVAQTFEGACRDVVRYAAELRNDRPAWRAMAEIAGLKGAA